MVGARHGDKRDARPIPLVPSKSNPIQSTEPVRFRPGRPRGPGQLDRCRSECQDQGIPTAASPVVPRRRMQCTTRPRPSPCAPGVEAFALSRPRPRPTPPASCVRRASEPDRLPVPHPVAGTERRLPASFRAALPRSHVRSRGARGTPTPAAPPGPGMWSGTGRQTPQVGSVRHGREQQAGVDLFVRPRLAWQVRRDTLALSRRRDCVSYIIF